MRTKINSLTNILISSTLIFSLNSCSNQIENYKENKKLTQFKQIQIKPQIKFSNSNKYALIISGEAEKRYRINMQKAYSSLISEGFFKENIYILDYFGQQFLNYPVISDAKKHNIEKIFEKLKKQTTNESLLFIYLTDHGNRILNPKNKNELISTISIPPRENYSQKEFSYQINQLKFKKGIFLFDQCNSGGFADEFENNKKIIAIASTLPNKKSKSSIFDSFGYHFFDSFNNLNADLNDNEKIELFETIKYIQKKHTQTKIKYQEPYVKGNYEFLNFDMK